MTILRALSLLFLLSCCFTFSAMAESVSYAEAAKKAVIGISHTSIDEAIKDDAFYMMNTIGVPVILETLGIDESDKTYGNGKFSEQIDSLEIKIGSLFDETSAKKISTGIINLEEGLKSEFTPDQLSGVMEALKTPSRHWAQTPFNEKLKTLLSKIADKTEIDYLSNLFSLLKKNGFKIPQRFEEHLSKVKAP